MNCFSCVPLELLYVAIISVSSLLKVVAVFFFFFLKPRTILFAVKLFKKELLVHLVARRNNCKEYLAAFQGSGVIPCSTLSYT